MVSEKRYDKAIEEEEEEEKEQQQQQKRKQQKHQAVFVVVRALIQKKRKKQQNESFRIQRNLVCSSNIVAVFLITFCYLRTTACCTTFDLGVTPTSDFTGSVNSGSGVSGKCTFLMVQNPLQDVVIKRRRRNFNFIQVLQQSNSEWYYRHNKNYCDNHKNKHSSNKKIFQRYITFGEHQIQKQPLPLLQLHHRHCSILQETTTTKTKTKITTTTIPNKLEQVPTVTTIFPAFLCKKEISPERTYHHQQQLLQQLLYLNHESRKIHHHHHHHHHHQYPNQKLYSSIRIQQNYPSVGFIGCKKSHITMSTTNRYGPAYCYHTSSSLSTTTTSLDTNPDNGILTNIDEHEEDYSLDMLQKRMEQYVTYNTLSSSISWIQDDSKNNLNDPNIDLESTATLTSSTTATTASRIRKRRNRRNVVVALSGGGGHFLSTLSSTPGASTILLEGMNTYDRISYQNYVEWDKVVAAALQSTTAQNYTNFTNGSNDQSSSSLSSSSSSSFKYCSSDATMYAADAALKRAMKITALKIFDKSATAISPSTPPSLSSSYSNLLQEFVTVPCGVACTSALQTTSSTRPGRVSSAHIAVHTPTGIYVTIDVQLASQEEQSFNTTLISTTATATTRRHQKTIRTRFDEDVFVSHWILSCLEYVDSVIDMQSNGNINSVSIDTGVNATTTTTRTAKTYEKVTSFGDIIRITIPFMAGVGTTRSTTAATTAATTTAATTAAETTSSTAFPATPDVVLRAPTTEARHCHHRENLYEAVNRILSGTEKCVLLVPTRTNRNMFIRNDASAVTTTTEDEDCSPIHRTNNHTAGERTRENDLYYYEALTPAATLLPPHSMIMPGSFNPPHQGHIELAKIAADTVHCTTIWFELSLTNVDKPPLNIDSIMQRLDYFLQLVEQDSTATNDNDDGDVRVQSAGTPAATPTTPTQTKTKTSIKMPANWGIVLTDAPLFKQKVDILTPLLVSTDYNKRKYDCNDANNQLHFCIGADTLVRLLDKKYYSDSIDQMYDTLTNHMPCHFVVGGRLEQKKKNNIDTKKSNDRDEPIPFITGEDEVKELPASLQQKFTLLTNFRIDSSSTELRQKKLTTS